MKIESLRDVKANLSKIVKKLPSDRSVVITKNGRPCAVLFPVTEDTDIESMVLAQNKEFWQLMDRAHKEGEKKGFTKLEDLPDSEATNQKLCKTSAFAWSRRLRFWRPRREGRNRLMANGMRPVPPGEISTRSF